MSQDHVAHALPLPVSGSLLPDDPQRRDAVLTMAAVGVCGACAAAVPFAASLQPSARALAAGAPVEVDISGLLPGQLRVVEWRGKPVWVLRRDARMQAALAPVAREKVDALLADPTSRREQQPPYARNAYRSIRPDVFVAVGICTHLGCSPIKVAASAENPAQFGGAAEGFFCPCHGSTFDLAGRVFRNKPAPTNLEVPPHRYDGSAMLLIGEDPTAA